MADQAQPVTSTTRSETNAVTPGETEAGNRRRSRLVGDTPDQISQRYYVEERGLRREQRLFENAHDAAPTIRDLGGRLIAASESAAVVRDLIEIARHRGWENIHATGSERFRRMIEYQAREHGIDVARPLSPDRERVTGGPTPRPSATTGRDRTSGDFRSGVTGIVIETGEAPFNGRPGQRPSPYIDLKLADGRTRRAWGAGLPAALAREQIEVGEMILLREDGTERAEGSKRSRKRWTAERQTERGRGTQSVPREPDKPEGPPGVEPRLSLGERFRRGSARERADDPDLRAAQSQLVAAKALASAYFAHNPVAAALVATRLEGMIASSLDKGGRFGIAKTRERSDGRHELVLSAEGDRRRADSPPKRDRHPEITKVRDRGRRR